MSEDKERDRRTDEAKRRLGRLRIVLIGVAALAIISCLAWEAGWWDFRSVDEKLAAIETVAARKVCLIIILVSSQ